MCREFAARLITVAEPRASASGFCVFQVVVEYPPDLFRLPAFFCFNTVRSQTSLAGFVQHRINGPSCP
jgi:hypothetical protein